MYATALFRKVEAGRPGDLTTPPNTQHGPSPVLQIRPCHPAAVHSIRSNRPRSR